MLKIPLAQLHSLVRFTRSAAGTHFHTFPAVMGGVRSRKISCVVKFLDGNPLSRFPLRAYRTFRLTRSVYRLGLTLDV
jgi:hypothetical protein